jgi:hypothetical protein
MGAQLARKELHVSNTLVAQALEHHAALRKIYAEMRQKELARIGREVKVIKLPPAGMNAMRRGASRLMSLLD